MADFIEFRNQCLDYLRLEKTLIDRDISEHDAMPVEKRVDLGLAICNVRLKCRTESSAVYSASVNNTKLRAGDEVILTSIDSKKSYGRFTVDVNTVDELAFAVDSSKEMPDCANVEVREFQGLDVIIKLLGVMRPGSPGVAYIEYLAGWRSPSVYGLGGITDIRDDEIPQSFNEAQKSAVRLIAKRPKLAYVQGTPGSGKTHLLAVAAKVFASRGKDVAIVALTHQAVNNALNKIAAVMPDANVVKIGKLFKNEGLSESVERHESFPEYVQSRKDSGHFIGRYGHIVGMSFLSAITNLGSRKTAFMPQVLLFDEAGQMPITHASVLGAFKCGSVVLIGDDRQMPPIYHPELEANNLSCSVFEVVKDRYPENGVVLNTTYRMNEEIAEFVGRRYYSPHGISLVSARESIGNRYSDREQGWRKVGEPSIEYALCECSGACDENPVEAEKVVEVVGEYLEKGLSVDRMAVITPYRRQVRMIHAKLRSRFGRETVLPMVDTVERLQGQDVDAVIVSFATDDARYYVNQHGFLLNPNRLNVMFSRATSKIVVVAGALVLDGIGLRPLTVDSGGNGIRQPMQTPCGGE